MDSEPKIQSTDLRLFDSYWEKTQLGKLRQLSRKDVQKYYDYFSMAHRKVPPNHIDYREMYIGAADRMAALQSELEFRRNRYLQISVALIGAVVLIGVALFQYSKPSNGNANPAKQKTQILPSPTESSKQPSP